MNLPDSLLSFPASMVGWLGLAATLALAAWQAPWHALLRAPLRLNLIFASILALSLLWLLRAHTLPGLSVHFLGLTAVTLLIGWSFALITGAAALIAQALFGHMGWTGVGVDFLGTVVPPILITTLIAHGAQRHLPPNIFVYLFVDVFLSACLGVLAATFGSALLVTTLGLYTWGTLWSSHLPLSLVQVIPEGIVNGMIMTAMALLAPSWVISFDESRYFRS